MINFQTSNLSIVTSEGMLTLWGTFCPVPKIATRPAIAGLSSALSQITTLLALISIRMITQKQYAPPCKYWAKKKLVSTMMIP